MRAVPTPSRPWSGADTAWWRDGRGPIRLVDPIPVGGAVNRRRLLYRRPRGGGDQICILEVARGRPAHTLKHPPDAFAAILDRVKQRAEDQRRFIQDIAHELRNPLAPMATSLDV